MPVPWLQIVQLMPSILEVSRELLKRSRRSSAGELPLPSSGSGETAADAALLARIRSLEENERRQAELVNSMAEQLAQLTSAVSSLHRYNRRLIMGQSVAVLIAVIAMLVALL
jgi:hypothetical protein